MSKEQSFFSRFLNGEWHAGTDRAHLAKVAVPGLAGDPAKIDSAPVWYSRHVTLPAGDWTHATLILKGARFMPAVYVNGDRCSAQPGGMAPTTHPLRHPAVAPGKKIHLEVELQPLDKAPADDASTIPAADRQRSNVSSCLWDDVVLRCHGPARIARLLPSYDHAGSQMTLRWRVDAEPEVGFPLVAEVIVRDDSGNALLKKNAGAPAAAGVWVFEVPEHWPRWSPDDPSLLQVHVTLKSGERILDQDTFRFGLRDFGVSGLGFSLNGEPHQMRAGTVVWHRWTRDPEARELAFNAAWFRENIVERLIAHGANSLRFHLGTPPENFLDMCDEAGLTVQAEWLFFHGIKASKAGMEAQWRNWLDLALRHPSVVLIHPWNETDDPAETGRAMDAIRAIEPGFPPFVLSHRDVFHLHRYWWSLFEDLGLDYDSPQEFSKPVVADEFGGNYLDGEGNPGMYPAVKGAFQRFLGRHHTLEDRLTLQRDACGRVAEYWRRLGVAGFSPFCILGSPEDGNHHFMGHLADATPKPVWDALTAAYSPITCSLELWDRNYLPGSSVKAMVHLFNDTDTPCDAVCMVHIEDGATSRPLGHDAFVRTHLPPRSRYAEAVTLPLPDRVGDFIVTAVLLDPTDVADYPIVSFWEIRTLKPVPPAGLTDVTVCVPGREPHLVSFLSEHGIRSAFDMPGASALLFGADAWNLLPRDPRLASLIESAIDRGVGVAMLDAGPRDDQHMRVQRDAGRPQIERGYIAGEPRVLDVPLFGGLRVRFKEAIEGESCIHPTENTMRALWDLLPAGATRIWNGRRGGLVVPAWHMEISGLSKEAFLSYWQERGAPVEKVRSGGTCTAYELDNNFAFADSPAPAVVAELRERVKFLADDAPALAARLNPNGPVKATDLAAAYRECPSRGAQDVRPLACAGASLVRTPVVAVDFGEGKGRLVISQLYTEGRLVRGTEEPGIYGTRHDPAAEQFAMNALRLATTADVAGPVT